MLQKIHLIDAHGDSFSEAVIDVTYTRVTKLSIKSTVEESIKTTEGDWVDEEQENEVEKDTVDTIKFKAEYWSSRENHEKGKLSRPLLDVTGEPLFTIDLNEEDMEKWLEKFEDHVTDNQKKVWFCERQLKEVILPALRG